MKLSSTEAPDPNGPSLSLKRPCPGLPLYRSMLQWTTYTARNQRVSIGKKKGIHDDYVWQNLLEFAKPPFVLAGFRADSANGHSKRTDLQFGFLLICGCAGLSPSTCIHLRPATALNSSLKSSAGCLILHLLHHLGHDGVVVCK